MIWVDSAMASRALRKVGAGALVAALMQAAPVRADVTAQGPMGFVTRNVVVIAGNPGAVWKRLVVPSGWWSGEHTFSGDAANLSLDPVAGGCFCERLPAEPGDAAKPGKPGAAPRPPSRGGVEHMRVVFVDRTKALRMIGGLGPLQSEAVSATLTVTLKQVEGGTRVIFEYVVGGYMRYPADKIAPAVDAVMADQLVALARLFGPVGQNAAAPAAAPAAPAQVAAPPPVGRGLDRKGLLVPRGKVWSLPSSGQATPPPPEPAPPIAPLPSTPVPQDVSVLDTSSPASPTAASAATPVPVAARPDAPAEPAPAAPKSKPRTKPSAKKPVPGVVAKPAPASDDPSRDSIESALDAAFPPPPPAPQ